MNRGESVLAANDKLVQSTLGKLRLYLEGLGFSMNLELPPLPKLTAMADVKEFCSGLLTPNSSEHPWSDFVRSLPKYKSASLTHSLFLFRKVLPSGVHPEEACKAYIDKMSSVGPPPCSEFLQFIRKEIPRLFPRGWDRGYRRRAGTLILPVKSCLEAGRKKGGARSLNGTDLRRLRRVALGHEVLSNVEKRAKVVGINKDGKVRVVTVSSVQQSSLQPLHDLLYDHLSKTDWLLRGDVNTRHLSRFTRVDGEVFTSGDYESATDNIPIEVTRTVLRTLRDTTNEVPESIWDFADDRCSLHFQVGCTPELREQRRGQLMGNFLSFPILCLINYLAFKWKVPRAVPVKINGDDIVFRSTVDEAAIWRAGVAGSGLTLSPGKTLESDHLMTLNSTPFIAMKTKVIAVPFVRARAFFNCPDSPSSLAGQYSALAPGYNGRARRWWQIRFLKAHIKMVLLSQRSLTRGLRMRVPIVVLKATGLLQRERYYSALAEEEPLPALGEPGVPQYAGTQGFQRVRAADFNRDQRRTLRLHSAAYGLACRLYAQSTIGFTYGKKGWVHELQKGTERYRPYSSSARRIFRRWAHLCKAWNIPTRGYAEERLVVPAEVRDKDKREKVAGREGVGWSARWRLDWDV